MNTRSARSGKVMKRVLLIAVLMGDRLLRFPKQSICRNTVRDYLNKKRLWLYVEVQYPH